MACLNLPLEIRYKPENIYLAGIIPGPKQPSLENLNHYICPLITQLATSWEKGVQYSQTVNYPQGHVTWSAIALAICDLPAAHHLAALAGTGSPFFAVRVAVIVKQTMVEQILKSGYPEIRRNCTSMLSSGEMHQLLLSARDFSKNMTFVILSFGDCLTGILCANLLWIQCTASLKGLYSTMSRVSSISKVTIPLHLK